MSSPNRVRFSIVIPCYNEEATLQDCVNAVLKIEGPDLELEVIIVDDASTDSSREIANAIANANSQVHVYTHQFNQGKGAALRTGFSKATGQFVAVQDADLEYDPWDLLTLIEPLVKGEADVVLGSRFLSSQKHRVLHFWHSMGNKVLTLLSNMFTDMNLTDMETCYKVFRREIIQAITIEENRFGFEPEVIAKVADMRCRVFESGISYRGRTYEEGKKIGVRDGFRALFCIVRYNAHRAPVPIQFIFYTLIGGIAAIINLFLFLVLFRLGMDAKLAAPIAFVIAAIVNYVLCINTIFRKQARWKGHIEYGLYFLVVAVAAVVDGTITVGLISFAFSDWFAKVIATLVSLVVNYCGRRFLVFPEPARGPWKGISRDSAQA